MKLQRLLILSVLLLAIGLGLFFGYCSGNAGFSTGIPISGTSLHICMATTGVPAISGFFCTITGILLLLIAFVTAIIGQVKAVLARSGNLKVPQGGDLES